MTGRTIAAVVVALALSGAGARAQDDGSPPATDQWQPVETAGPTGPGGLAILDLLGKLTIAVLVAYGLAHGARLLQQRGLWRQAAPAEGERALRLIECLPLGADGRLYLVSVDGTRVLLAAREGAVRRIELADDRPMPAPTYRAITPRPGEVADEVNISQARLSTRPVRSDVVTDPASWAERRDKLLRQLQDT